VGATVVVVVVVEPVPVSVERASFFAIVVAATAFAADVYAIFDATCVVFEPLPGISVATATPSPAVATLATKAIDAVIRRILRSTCDRPIVMGCLPAASRFISELPSSALLASQ
jgi:hypothetical protein